MKQTEIDYRVLPNGKIQFVALRNVADQNEIDKEIDRGKSHRYYCGRAYYSLATVGEPNTVRIHNEHEPLGVCIGGHCGYKDFKVGEVYEFPEWEFFINFLKAAGERYTKIHHAKEEPLFPVKTVKI